MDFNLTPEQNKLQELARDFTREYITPVANELEKQNEVPLTIMQKAYELGLMNLHVPKDVGGPGLNLLDETIVTEEVGYGCAGCATSMGANNLALAPILLAATKNQLNKYITPLITGNEVKFFSFCPPYFWYLSFSGNYFYYIARDGWVLNPKCQTAIPSYTDGALIAQRY